MKIPLIDSGKLLLVMKKILVAVDGSEFSKVGFDRSLAEAQELGNKLVILRVVRTYEEVLGGDIPGALGREIEKAEQFTEELKEEARGKGVEAEAEVITGTDVATEIVKYADKEDCDVIVVGSRGKTDLETIH